MSKKLLTLLALLCVLLMLVGSAFATPNTPSSVAASYNASTGEVLVAPSPVHLGYTYKYNVYSVTLGAYVHTGLTTSVRSGGFLIALSVAQTYRIEVALCDVEDCSAYRNSNNVSVPDVTAFPRNCSVSVLNNSITTTWTKGAPCITHDSSFQWQGYNYQRSPNPLVYGNITGNPTSHTISSLAAGSYVLNYGCVNQSTYNSFGTMASVAGCNGLNATIVPVPTAPSGLSATSQVNPSGVDFRVNLSWTDTSSNETGFQVYRNSVLIATLGANVTSYIDSDASTPGASHSYYVRAYNASGGDNSNTANVTNPAIAAPVLNPTTAITGTGGWSVNLAWVDKSSNEDGFEVFRNGVNIMALSPNATSFTDTGLSASTTYSYYVRAWRSGGFTASSNTINVSTGALPTITSATCTPATVNHGSSTTCTVSATDPNAGAYGALTYQWTTSADGTFTAPTTSSSGLSYSQVGSKTANVKVCLGTTEICVNQDITVTVNPLLTVNKNGTGTVTSVPAGINCGATCSAAFGNGSSVTLTATPTGGSSFTGWGGDCTGVGSCVLTMSANRTVTANFEACTYTITPDNASASATGGSLSVSVTPSNSACTWTSTSNAAWITVTAGASGTGNGTVSLSVAANTGIARTGTVTIAGQTFTVNQASGCTYTITPDNASASATGGSLSVSVTPSNSACTWTSTSNAAWITVTAGASGTGNGTVSLSVAANTGIARTGTVTIAGQTFTVNQAVSTYTITPSATVGGTISPSTPVTVNYGEGRTFTMTANSGYVLWEVLVDGSPVGAVTPYTFENVTSNKTIQALFAVAPTITSAACTPATVNHGSSTTCTVSATDPNNGLFGPLTYQWMTSHDGTFTAPTASSTGLSYAEAGSKTATVRVCIGSTGICQTAVTCPLGGTYNLGTMKCEYAPTVSCLSGYTYNSTTQKCEANPQCATGSTYNASTSRCEVAMTSCVSGYTYNSTTQKCEANPTCLTGGSYNTTSDNCRATATNTCATGYTYNSTTQKCEANPQCPTGSTYNASTNRCEVALSTSYVCPLNSQSYTTSSACSSACTQSASCTASGGTNTSQITSIAGTRGVQTESGNIRIFQGGTYGSWIPVNGGGTSHYSTAGGAPSITIRTQYNAIAFGSGTNYGGAVPATGSGTSTWQCEGVEVSGGQIRYIYQNYDSEVGCTGTVSYGAWIPLNPTTTCPLGVSFPCSGDPLTCSQTGTCTTSNSCPSGFTQSGSLCYQSATCATGGTLNGTTDKCEATASTTCPTGYTYNSTTGFCQVSATCATGGTLNGTTDKCELSGSVTCPTGYTYNSTTGFCQVSATCATGGTLNVTTDKCEATITPCPTGFTLSGSICWNNPVCLGGGTFNAVVNKCQGSPIITCSQGAYNGTLCISSPAFGCPAALTCVNRDIPVTVNPFIEVIKGGAGTGIVTSTPSGIGCGEGCKAYFSIGGSVTLTATPTGGSSFTGWGGDCTGAGSCVLTMSANRTVTANFEACTYTITPDSASPLATGGSLSVSVTPSNSACTWTSTSNAAWITVTAGASGTGNGTVSLSVDANTGIARTGTVTIAGQTFTVNQAVSTYTITPSATVGGTISPSTPVTVNYGEGRTFTMTANDGAYLYDVLVDNSSVGAVTSYSFENVTSNRTIKALFAVAPTITSAACSPNPVNHNAQATCTVVVSNPNTGWGTLDYLWTTSAGGTFTTPAASSTGLTFVEPGSKTVNVKTCFVENPALCAEQAVTIQVAIVPPQITSINCPQSLWQGETGECSGEATAQWGTVKYQWVVVPDGTINNDTAGNPSVMFMTAGNKTVRLRAYIEQAVNVFSEQAVTVQVRSAAPQINSIACPESVYVSQVARCSVDATIPFGDIAYQWMTNWDGTITPSGNSADITYTVVGTKSLTVKAYRADLPALSHTQVKTINVKHFDIAATITCASNSEPAGTFYQLKPLTCQLAFTNQESLPGTPSITWTTSADGVITGEGNTVEVLFSRHGGKVVTANIGFSEIPNIVKKNHVVNVVSSAPTVTALVCPTSIFRNQTGECTATATSPWGQISYEWSIDKGTVTPSGNSAQITSDIAGTRTVEVKASINDYPQLSTTRKAYVRIDSMYPPTLNINIPAQVIRNTPVTLTATASSSQGNVKVEWNIDGQIYEGLSVELTLTEVKAYNVIVKAMIEGHEDDPVTVVTRTGKITVTPMPKPIISINVPFSIMQNQTIEITGNVTSKHNPVVTKWTLPDGSEVNNSLAASYKFAQGGSQTIMLSAYVEGYDMPEETAIVSKNVLVRVYTFPDFKIRRYGTSQGYAPFFTYFMAETNMTQLAGATFNYHWDFGDGDTVASRSSRVATHTFKDPGVYTVTFTVTDMYEETKTDSVTVTVLEAPPIEINLKTISTNRFNRVPFVVVTTPRITGGNPQTDRIIKYEWSLNGSPAGRGTSIASIPLATPGEHSIGLTVTTKTGKTATGRATVTANENKPPECSFIYTDYPQYKYTKLVSKCIDPDGRIVKYHWDLGDGTTSLLNVAFPKYTESGTYTVTLTATDDSGSSTSFTQSITVSR